MKTSKDFEILATKIRDGFITEYQPEDRNVTMHGAFDEFMHELIAEEIELNSELFDWLGYLNAQYIIEVDQPLSTGIYTAVWSNLGTLLEQKIATII